MKKQLLLLVMFLLPMVASAYDLSVKNADGITIYYNYINNGTELEVTRHDSESELKYKGIVVIPNEVTYMNRNRKVTSIGNHAFSDCYSLTSVTIPNSVTSIGNYAFSGCGSLTSITIPNSVTSIGDCAFGACRGLTSVIIPNSVTSIGWGTFGNCPNLTSVTIPNSVTSIENAMFSECSSLTSIIIPNSVTSIGSTAFLECSALTSITIPNSVTSIGSGAFYYCSGLTSITIPNSVTRIEDMTFEGCSSLTSVIIGNSVTYIGTEAFYGCSSLTSVTIPNSVMAIGGNAFNGWDLPVVISLIVNPFRIDGKESSWKTFSQNTFNNATLYVPVGTIDKYKSTDGWKDFLFIEEGTGGDSGGGTAPEKCSKPTISYQNGQITFNCETENVQFSSSITDADIKKYSTATIQLGVTYNISVYATKAGYDNSETAMATLCWIDKEPTTEGITDGVAQIPSKAVLIQSEGGILKVEGIDDGTQVSVYTPDGKQAGSAVCRNGAALVGTNILPGNTVIVKIGEKAVKVIVK